MGILTMPLWEISVRIVGGKSLTRKLASVKSINATSEDDGGDKMSED